MIFLFVCPFLLFFNLKINQNGFPGSTFSKKKNSEKKKIGSVSFFQTRQENICTKKDTENYFILILIESPLWKSPDHSAMYIVHGNVGLGYFAFTFIAFKPPSFLFWWIALVFFYSLKKGSRGTRKNQENLVFFFTATKIQKWWNFLFRNLKKSKLFSAFLKKANQNTFFN